MARVVGVQGFGVDRTLSEGWHVAPMPPSAADSPASLAALAPAWLAAEVPGTAASALRRAGRLDARASRDFDADDWWYRCRFASPAARAGQSRVLSFEGLATICDAWLNDAPLFHHETMFVPRRADVGALLRGDNELVLRFSALTPRLTARRPRPRWRTKIVAHQQLRWLRTTLLGRVPGWSPPVAPVGPYRPVTLEEREGYIVEDAAVRATLVEGRGRVDVSVRLRGVGRDAPPWLRVDVGDARATLAAAGAGGERVYAGHVTVESPARWWPHTHGPSPLYAVSAAFATDEGEARIELGRVGFREIVLDTVDGGFTLRVNGERVFCRGACWTSPDLTRFGADAGGYRSWLETARAAGMNMLRVGGTMSYEADAFYDLCDELGVLVWQDFMFANMDYPTDEAFIALVREEATAQLARLETHPSVALYCGGSEIAQQAAMLGLAPEAYTSRLFEETLPQAVASRCPGTPYWPASPGGGALPFHVDEGVAHYYGVGAYLRPPQDARAAGVRFASECLAFANVPDAPTIELFMRDGEAPPHHPSWKARAPRDTGPGWDFDDVRDHYMARLFGVDVAALRYADVERYLALGRLASGEMMAATFAEWRRPRSSCAGGLVWFFQDLWPGAGWGVVDSTGRPKAAYYFLKRAFQPRCAFFTDEGLNGLRANVLNESALPFEALLTLTLYRGSRPALPPVATELRIAPRGASSLAVESLLGSFVDSTYAYRFGPPSFDLAVATLSDAHGARVGDAFYSPLGPPISPSDDVGLSAVYESQGGDLRLRLRASRYAYGVSIEVDDFLPDDNYFNIAPEGERIVRLTPLERATTTPSGVVRAANARAPSRVVAAAPPTDRT